MAGSTFRLSDPLPLACGQTLAGVELAYATYGTLNADRSNAILICHALTGDHHVAGTHPLTGRPGWWARSVGPGLPIDTDRYFVICSNVLGGCMGSTGPASLASDGQAWGLRLPPITIADMVAAQTHLIAHLGVERLFAVIGGSMGGMQALEWAVSYPDRLAACAAIATTSRHSAQNIAFYEIGRQAIMADPDWCEGAYLAQGTRPAKGLGVARMAAHVTYVSEVALQRKFGRLRRVVEQAEGAETGGMYEVESYLRAQGARFVDRFDANSYLYITRAIDAFDLSARADGHLAHALKAAQARFCIVAFSSDWHYPPGDSKVIARSLAAADKEVSYLEIETDKGHDAFLLDEPDFDAGLRGFLSAIARAEGLPA